MGVGGFTIDVGTKKDIVALMDGSSNGIKTRTGTVILIDTPKKNRRKTIRSSITKIKVNLPLYRMPVCDSLALNIYLYPLNSMQWLLKWICCEILLILKGFWG